VTERVLRLVQGNLKLILGEIANRVSQQVAKGRDIGHLLTPDCYH
jgi:tetrahydromethanopterin S-methyltransferase subunit G